jgi:hypothetical protein
LGSGVSATKLLVLGVTRMLVTAAMVIVGIAVGTRTIRRESA